MAIYTVKHENVRTNMSEELLRLLVKQSFIKIDKKDEMKMLFKLLDERANVDDDIEQWLAMNGLRQLKMLIIDIILAENYSLDLNAPTIDRVFRNWIKNTPKLNIVQKRKIFYHTCI